jgi:hypothetical protein
VGAVRDGGDKFPPECHRPQTAKNFGVKAIRKIDLFRSICSGERMRANRLQNALKQLRVALREAEAALEELRGEHDALALQIFVSRRQYRNMPDTKSGKRSQTAARVSWQTACDLGFRGSLEEWLRLLGASSKR